MTLLSQGPEAPQGSGSDCPVLPLPFQAGTKGAREACVWKVLTRSKGLTLREPRHGLSAVPPPWGSRTSASLKLSSVYGAKQGVSSML